MVNYHGILSPALLARKRRNEHPLVQETISLAYRVALCEPSRVHEKSAYLHNSATFCSRIRKM